MMNTVVTFDQLKRLLSEFKVLTKTYIDNTKSNLSDDINAINSAVEELSIIKADTDLVRESIDALQIQDLRNRVQINEENIEDLNNQLHNMGNGNSGSTGSNTDYSEEISQLRAELEEITESLDARISALNTNMTRAINAIQVVNANSITRFKGFVSSTAELNTPIKEGQYYIAANNLSYIDSSMIDSSISPDSSSQYEVVWALKSDRIVAKTNFYKIDGISDKNLRKEYFNVITANENGEYLLTDSSAQFEIAMAISEEDIDNIAKELAMDLNTNIDQND